MKLCECGCGQPAPLARQTRSDRGCVAGQPQRFIKGHFQHPKRTASEAFYECFVSGDAGACWPWRGQQANTGYGRVSFAGRRELAHRVSYEIHHGPIPQGMDVCHECDNPICVNPAHLSLGTHAENMADMVSKGRHRFGEGTCINKLTTDDVRQIRRLYAGGESQKDIAARFGIVPSSVSQIVNRKTWTHVEE